MGCGLGGDGELAWPRTGLGAFTPGGVSGIRLQTGPSRGSTPGVISGHTSIAETRSVSKKSEAPSAFLRSRRERFVVSGSLSIMQCERVPRSLIETHLTVRFILRNMDSRGGPWNGLPDSISPPLLEPGVRAISAVIDTIRARWFPRQPVWCENVTSPLCHLPKIFNLRGLSIFARQTASIVCFRASKQQ